MSAHLLQDRTLRARAAFAAGYLALQLALIATAPLRPDHAFGFQMFNASSLIRIALYRKVAVDQGAVVVVPIRGGVWSARDAHGARHRFRWRDRVRDPVLATLDHTTHAKNGVDAQLSNLRYALEDVTRHIQGDAETLALIARVRAWDNGRPRAPLELEAARP